MSARLLLEVALRVLGIWFLCMAIMDASTSIWYLSAVFGQSSRPFGFYGLIYFGISVAIRLAIGIALIRWAPGISARFYPADRPSEEQRTTVSPGDIFHTACFVLGAYLLVQGTVSALGMSRSMSGADFVIHFALAAAVYGAGGLFLIFGARRIGEFLAGLRYDPESIPKQQFSLRLLLIVVGVVAVVLGVVRMISMRGM